MTEIHEPSHGEDGTDETRTIARLLRVAGPRAASPGERFERVRRVAHAHWQDRVRRRIVRRRVAVGMGLLAAAAALVLMVGRLGDDRAGAPPPASVVARVVKIGGSPGDVRRPDAAASPRALAVGDALRAGESLETGGTGRMAMRFEDGTSLRLDVASRVRLLTARAIDLSSGAVYVDTGSDTGRFEVRTPMGTARDIGTQFEVRLIEDRLRVRVRTGVVELSDRGRSVTGRAGTEILLLATGAESRPLVPYGPEWGWSAEVSPTIDIEGLSLSTYLDRMAREHGWTVQYDDPALARDSGSIILHGSVAGLTPTEALDVAIGTSGFAYRLEHGRLVVFRETPR